MTHASENKNNFSFAGLLIELSDKTMGYIKILSEKLSAEKKGKLNIYNIIFKLTLIHIIKFYLYLL